MEDGMREKPQRVVRGEKDDQKKDGEEKIEGHSGGYGYPPDFFFSSMTLT